MVKKGFAKASIDKHVLRMADSREKARNAPNKSSFSPAKGVRTGSGFNTFDGRGAQRQITNTSESPPKKLKIMSSKTNIKMQTFHH